MSLKLNNERWYVLTNDPDSKLTEQEIADGWHFCPEMDGLLANSNDPEGDCFCLLSKDLERPSSPVWVDEILPEQINKIP